MLEYNLVPLSIIIFQKVAHQNCAAIHFYFSIKFIGPFLINLVNHAEQKLNQINSK